MMDIYSYVNSRDIREYLRKTEYQFNTLQVAWLIYFCNRLTLEEKKSALAELISTKQNYEMLKRWNENVVDIIHSDIITDEMHYILDCSFEELWFDFPTPFEKGDIVWLPPKDYNREQHGFVTLILDELGYFNPLQCVVNSGDYTDMVFSGYFVDPDGTVYHDALDNYMNLEYYPGPYEGIERIFPAFSKCIKGEIDLGLFLCVYKKVLLDTVTADTIPSRAFPHKLIKELGLD